jgi:hypothetical protein
VTRNTAGEQRPSDDMVYHSVGQPLLRTLRKSAFARFFLDILDMLARGRKRRHDPGQGQEADNR